MKARSASSSRIARTAKDKRVKQLTEEEVTDIKDAVRRRDKYRCVIHGTPTFTVHEILQKSSGRVRSAKVFQMKYMACVCEEICHEGIHRGAKKKEINGKILHVLKTRHNYDYGS